jgi:hypothetical protein
MPFQNEFRTDSPTGASLANQIDDFIAIDTKSALDERYDLEHYSLVNGNTEPENVMAQGRHVPGLVGCMFYGLYNDLINLSFPGEGAIGYATDTPGFYHYIDGSGWTPLSMSTDALLADEETLHIQPGAGGGGEAILEMKHDNQQWTTTHTIASSASVDTNCNLSNSFYNVLTAPAILEEPVGAQIGATYIWILEQGGGGGFNMTFDAIFRFESGIAPSLSTAAGSIDVVSAIYHDSGGGGYFLCSIMYDVKTTP